MIYINILFLLSLIMLTSALPGDNDQAFLQVATTDDTTNAANPEASSESTEEEIIISENGPVETYEEEALVSDAEASNRTEGAETVEVIVAAENTSTADATATPVANSGNNGSFVKVGLLAILSLAFI